MEVIFWVRERVAVLLEIEFWTRVWPPVLAQLKSCLKAEKRGRLHFLLSLLTLRTAPALCVCVGGGKLWQACLSVF